MKTAIHYFTNNALSTNTHSAYSSGVRAFLTFCAMFGIPNIAPNFPICSEDVFLYFIAHCEQNLKLQFSTIKLYLSAVRFHYVSNGLGNPFSDHSGATSPRLALVLKGIKKSQTTKPNKRGPITGSILINMCLKLRSGCLGRYPDKLMLAVCLTAFFGFLRCGEFTTKSVTFDSKCNLCLQDVVIQKNIILVTIKVSKCDPFRKGCVIQLFRNNTSICPYNAMIEYLTARNQVTNDPLSPLFMLPNLLPLSRNVFVKWLNILCPNPAVTTHSFRIGAASVAAAAHLPEYIIQMLGRWSSDCYLRYIRTPHSMLHKAQTDMAKMVLEDKSDVL